MTHFADPPKEPKWGPWEAGDNHILTRDGVDEDGYGWDRIMTPEYANALEACAALLAECDWNFNEYGEYSEDVQAALDRLKALQGTS